MSTANKGYDLLTEQLFTNNSPVTYKYISRSLGLQNSEAKKILADFYDAFKGEHAGLTRSYILVGKPKSEVSQVTTLIKILTDIEDQDQLDKQTDQLFEAVHSCNYYGLSPSQSLSAKEVINSGKALTDKLNVELSQENLRIWGDITLARAVEVSQDPISLASQTQNLIKKEASPVAASPAVRSKTAPTSSSTAPAPKADFFGSKYVSRKVQKLDSQSQSSSAEEAKPSFSYKSRKNEVKPAKVVVDSNKNESMDIDDDDFDKSSKTKTVNKNDKKIKEENDKKLSVLFADDEDFEFSDDLNSQKETGVDSVEPEEVEIEQVADESIQEVEQVESAPTVASMIKQHAAKAKKESTPEPEVEETEQYYDEEGYLVTRVKATSKSKPRPKPTKRASTEPIPKKHTIDVPDSKPSDPKKKKTTQSSLMNFFGSKKK